MEESDEIRLIVCESLLEKWTAKTKKAKGEGIEGVEGEFSGTCAVSEECWMTEGL